MTLSLDKTTATKTITYAINSDIYKDFYIDIVDDGENRHAYIYHKGGGHKMFIYGSPKKQDTLSKFLEYLRFDADDDISTLLEENNALEKYYCEKFSRMEV